MSSIDKMIIQGIRSFGFTDRDRQIITFYSPLTLILGPNGTGKTTVIESLRYVTTGDMPPGCGRGGAFVHDPKIADEREVKGQVKLQFYDISKRKVVITRSLTATQKEKRIECKTIDGTLTIVKEDGEKESITSKCVQLDQLMSSLLGVSKAILNNVIFCHQEDANWPLSEGKTLKTKFDDIFAATRYIKALDAIKKSKTELDTEFKECRISGSFLKENKIIAEGKAEDLNKTQSRLSASLDSISKIQEKLKPIENRLEIITSKQKDIYKLKIDIEKLISKKQQIEKMQLELKDKIENEFSGSIKDLQKLQSEFHSQIKKKEQSLKNLDKQQDLLDQQVKRLQKKKSSLLQELGKRNMEATTHNEKIEQRKILIKTSRKEYKLKEYEGEEDDVSSFNDQLSQFIKSQETDENNVKKKFEDQEKDFQIKLDNVRETKSKLEQTVYIKQETINKNEDEIKNLTQELSNIAVSGTKIEHLERCLKKSQTELEDVEKTLDVNIVKSEIAEHKDKKIDIGAKIEQLNLEINKCHQQNSIRTELELLTKDRTTKEDQIRKLTARHEDTLKHLFGHIPSENLHFKIDDFIQKQNDGNQVLMDQLQKNRVMKSSREVKKKLLMKELNKQEAELKGFEEQFFELCGSQDFDQGVEVLETSMGALQDEKGALSGMQHLYKKYIELLQQRDSCCPVCHRGFDEEQDITELVHELESKLRLIPKQLEIKEKQVNEQQQKHKQMIALKPSILTMKQLQEGIPELKQELKNLNIEIERLQQEIVNDDEALQMKQTDEAVAKSIQSDMVLLDQAQNDIRNLEKKISTMSSKLGFSDSFKTVQQVTSEKNDVQMEFDNLCRKIETKQQKINDYTEHVHELRKNINEMKEEKLNITNNLQKQSQLEGNKLELVAANNQCKKEILESKKKIQPLEISIVTICEEKEKVIIDKNNVLQTTQLKINKVKVHRQTINQLSKEIEKYLVSGGPKALLSSKEELKEIDSQLDSKESEKETIVNEIDGIRKHLSQEQVRTRELQDTIQLRQWDKEIDTLENELTSKKTEMGDFQVMALDKEAMQLDKERRLLIKEKDQADGRQNELQTAITKLQKELESEPYKDIEVKYRKNLIKLKTTELASKDLQKYYQALDGAIMRFHSMKMEEINKIIRDLWRNTYRGNDIDYIEICSDADETGNTSDKLRRVYHYRVIMVKNDRKLDMRGRCSAGQKVLASLIIRLALAETFCLNCGILALDEPTTNLDRDNIESLANALVEIIKNRSRQKNFQLLIITHDEDFVELLGRSDYVDYYYRVKKSSDSLSQLERCAVQNLQM